MGVVYEAEQISLGRRVALKVLPFAAAMDPPPAPAVQDRGPGRGAVCTTPTSCRSTAVGCERGVHYYAMQFIEGRTLADVIRELRAARGDGEAP